MNDAIRRQYSHNVVTIANGTALSDAMSMRQFAGGIVSVPGTWTSASIGFKHSASATGTFQPLYDKNGNLVQMAVSASGDYVMPVEVFACHYIKLWSQNGSGADANQAADRTLQVLLKG